MSAYDAKKIKSIRPLHDHVLVTMNFKERVTRSGIIIQSTDGKLEGMHARWGQVYAVGNDNKIFVLDNIFWSNMVDGHVVP